MGREEQYFESPLEFKPERWTPEFEKDLPKGVYFPFSSGPRVCIGEGFSMMEAIILLASITQSFRLDYHSIEPVTPFPSITLTPGGGMKMKVSARTSQLTSDSSSTGSEAVELA